MEVLRSQLGLSSYHSSNAHRYRLARPDHAVKNFGCERHLSPLIQKGTSPQPRPNEGLFFAATLKTSDCRALFSAPPQWSGLVCVQASGLEHAASLHSDAVGVLSLRAHIRRMVTLTVAEPDPRYRTRLLDLRMNQCRFIISDDVRNAVYCGAPTQAGSSWCAWHRRLVYTRPSVLDGKGQQQRPRQV